MNGFQTIYRPIFFSFGVVLCGFASFFMFTGFDEIFTKQDIWYMGLGIFGVLFFLGVAAVWIALNKNKKTPLAIDLSFFVSCAVLLFGFWQILNKF